MPHLPPRQQQQHDINREHSCLAAASSVCDSTKHNGLVTDWYQTSFILFSNLADFFSIRTPPYTTCKHRDSRISMYLVSPKKFLPFPWARDRQNRRWCVQECPDQRQSQELWKRSSLGSPAWCKAKYQRFSDLKSRVRRLLENFLGKGNPKIGLIQYSNG